MRAGAEERQAGDFVRVYADRVGRPTDVVDGPTAARSSCRRSRSSGQGHGLAGPRAGTRDPGVAGHQEASWKTVTKAHRQIQWRLIGTSRNFRRIAWDNERLPQALATRRPMLPGEVRPAFQDGARVASSRAGAVQPPWL